MTILAIDPGTEQSAWMLFDGKPLKFGITRNEQLLDELQGWAFSNGEMAAQLGVTADCLVVEMVASYGMAVGAEIFTTVFWTGRFCERWSVTGKPYEQMFRRECKLHLCGSSKAKDANVRQALLDLYGGSSAVGRKKTPGPLYGVSKDTWAALAVAQTWWDTKRQAS